MKAAVVVSLVDREEQQVLGQVFARNLSDEDLQIGRLWKINGRFWRLTSAAHAGTNHSALGFEEVNRHHLRARPWCHDGVWMAPRSRPGK